MTDEIKSYDNLRKKNNIEHDLQNTAGYKKYWTSKPTNCSWLNNSLHWHHCDKETMENMSSTLPHIQKVLISIGNTVTDSIIQTDNEFQNLKTILNQQKIGRIDQRNKDIDEFTSLIEKITDLQNDLTSLRLHELSHLKKLTEQNQQIINMIKPINITQLESNIQELNKKIPNIEPLLKEFEKMFRTLDNISRSTGLEE